MKSHTLRCAGDYGAAPGQSRNHSLRKVWCPLDTAALTDKEDTSSSTTNPRSDLQQHRTEDNIVVDIVSKGPASPASDGEAPTERKIDCA